MTTTCPTPIRNVEDWHGGRPATWEVHLGDVVEHLPDLQAHRVVLDVLEPWTVVPAAAEALAPGGVLLTYTPTVTQLMRVHEACEADGRFADVATTETFQRGWDVDGLAVRPAHRMVAHTAFLTTARRVLAGEEGGPPRRTRSGGPGIAWVDDTSGSDD